MNAIEINRKQKIQKNNMGKEHSKGSSEQGGSKLPSTGEIKHAVQKLPSTVRHLVHKKGDPPNTCKTPPPIVWKWRVIRDGATEPSVVVGYSDTTYATEDEASRAGRGWLDITWLDNKEQCAVVVYMVTPDIETKPALNTK